MFARAGIVGSIFALMLGGLVGCSGSGSGASGGAVQGLESTHKAMNDVGTHIDSAMSSLTAMQTGGDLQKKFAAYEKEVKAIESRAAAVKKASEDMHVRSDKYIAKWQAEMDKTSSPELKSAAESRREQLRARYGEVTSAYDELRTQYKAFHDQLVNIRTYLANDLTPAGVQAAEPSIQKATADAAALRASADKVRTTLRNIADDMRASRR